MIKRNIFYNNRRKKKFMITLFLLLFFTVAYYLYVSYTNKEIFEIPIYNNKYYIIPQDIGGKEIPDYGINILEKKRNSNSNNKYNENLPEMLFSLQLFQSKAIDDIENKINYLVNAKKINKNNLYIGQINSDIDQIYVLLYNNYENKILAKNGCNSLKSKGINCLVVNTKNL